MAHQVVPLVLLLALSATGCSDRTAATGPDDAADPPATAPAAPAPATSPPPAGTVPSAPPVDEALPPARGEDLPAYTTAASSAAVTSTGPEAPILRAVRIAAHHGFDRIVFEFDTDGLPQWHVAYVEAPVIQCGSGQAMPVDGSAWLQVRFNGANAHTEAGVATSGPARRPAGLASVREVVRTCDFEAEVTWVAGVAAKRPYRPRALRDPSRLVVDIAH